MVVNRDSKFLKIPFKCPFRFRFLQQCHQGFSAAYLENFHCAYATARSRPLQLLPSPSHLNTFLCLLPSFLPDHLNSISSLPSLRASAFDQSLLFQDRFSSRSTYLVLGSSATMGHEQSVGKLKEYVDSLEKERRKIEVFQRELPLCMQLVTHAIEGCKQQIMGSGERLVSDGPSDCEVTSNEGPVLEEFIPLKRSSEEEDGKRDGDGDEISFAGEKPDWLRSVQLWTRDNDPPSKQERKSVIEPNKSNGAFHPFCRDDKVTKPAASSTAESGGTTNEKAAGRAGQRKTRRCWSPELHKRFLQALEQLGGSRAATPKQIKELMKVDGLTNDEVKSHLQKYRLHNSRPGHAAQSQSNGDDAHALQFVVVGGIWVPPPEYSPAADSGGQGTKVYAPKPRFPSIRQRQEEVHSAGSRGANSGESPATSTSSHVTATSPAA